MPINFKDEGNVHFKKGRFQQAIKSYRKYVSIHHDDNVKAYGNMALSYFKSKQYKQCIQASQAAIQIQPTFDKAYYRMYEAYKQLNDTYNMLLVGNKFCKCSKEQKQILQIQKEFIKLKSQLSRNQLNQNDKLGIKNLTIILELQQQQRQNQQINNNDKQQERQQVEKWTQIQAEIKRNVRLGTNLARKFIANIKSSKVQQTQKKQKINQYAVKLKQLRKSIMDSKDEESKEKRQSQHHKQNSQEWHSVDDDQDSQGQQSKPLLQKQQKQLNFQSTKENSDLNQNKAQQTTGNQDQKQVESALPTQSIPQERTNELFKKHIQNNLEKSVDVFSQFLKRVKTVAETEQLNISQKKAVLQATPSLLKKFALYVKSNSQKERQQLKQLFQANKVYTVKIEKTYNL